MVVVAAGWWCPPIAQGQQAWAARYNGSANSNDYLNCSAWFVKTMFGAPVFLTQPFSRTNDAGTTATFNILAVGTAPFCYQWRKDGVTLVDGVNIAGALTPTLTVTNVFKSDEGGYSVMVTNAQGSVTSAKARLTVASPVITTQQRPRTIREALARQQDNPIADHKMQRESDVKRWAAASFDVKATSRGVYFDENAPVIRAYDAVFIAAVQQRWYDLLGHIGYSHERKGKVVLKFRLCSDGSITDLKVAENDVGVWLGYLCQSAILDPAPYADWPSDMQRRVGADFREVGFTFYYN